MLILASKSPRRIELLKLAGLDFISVPALSEERADMSLPPEQVVLSLARGKAAEISAKYPSDIVIGADTVVYFDGNILGKPKGEADARRMLSMLSDNVHSVYTGVCIISGGKEHSFYEKTDVAFYPLTDREIDEYIATGEPMDKAGAYGIQEKGFILVKGISGDYYNVVGLPLAKTVRTLKEFDDFVPRT